MEGKNNFDKAGFVNIILDLAYMSNIVGYFTFDEFDVDIPLKCPSSLTINIRVGCILYYIDHINQSSM